VARYFLMLNEWRWSAPPSIDAAEAAVVAIAAGDWDEQRTAPWLRPRVAAASDA
jgi:prophage maintenance system killer protein